jgi:hypothetical protein
MNRKTTHLLASLALLAAAMPLPAMAADTPSTRRDASRIQWGNDTSKYAKDGECDDKRFTGPGMTSTPLLDSDISHDATDCRAAYEQNRLELRT